MIRNLDRPLLLVVAALLLLGLYNLASAGIPFGAALHVSQGAHVLVGAGLMLVVAAIHYRSYEVLAIPAYILAITLLGATDVFGKVVNGSRRWLAFGSVNVQTSDLAKLAVILILARTLHLERTELGGLTLRDIFRPMNVSRPLLLVLLVLAVTVLGDRIKPPALERMVGRHSRPVARLKGPAPAVTVGRARDSDVRFPFEGVSERHAEVRRAEDGGYLVRDLRSDGGTFLNGQRIEGERPLVHGDVLHFGPSARTELTFKAPIQRVLPWMPYLAVLAAGWLFLSLYLQFFSGRSFSARDLVAPIDLVVIPAGLILAQPDLGTAMVVVLVAFTMLLFVGLRPLSLLLLGLFGGAAVVLAWVAVLKPYQKDRVLTFLNPESDLAGAGYHQHQSMIAVGSGGWTGQGHGQGTQTQLSFLPEQQTDFIFSVWAEEQGFLGGALVVLLFLALVLLCLRVVATARDRFGALLAVGVTALVFWHAAINMLMVLQLAPVVGVPLPLFSNGGSFVITVLVGMGLVFSVALRRSMF